MRLFLTCYWTVATGLLLVAAIKTKRGDCYFFALICFLFLLRSLYKLYLIKNP